MAISVPNFKRNSISAGSSAITCPNFSSTTGNLLVAGVTANLAGGPGTISSVKNAAGVSFTLVPGSAFQNGSVWTVLYYLPNITGNASDNVTANNPSAPSNSAIFVWEIAGCKTSSPLDQVAGATGSAALITSNAYTTTNPNEIIIACSAIGAANTMSAQSSPAYTLDYAGDANAGAGAEHLIVSTKQTSITTSATWSGAAADTLSVATFAAPLVGGGSSSWLTVALQNSLRGLRH